MTTSGNVPVPCTAATDAVVQLPAGSKPLSKLLGAYACQAARRRVLEHIALIHGARVVVPRKSPSSLVDFSSLPVTVIITPATTAAARNTLMRY